MRDGRQGPGYEGGPRGIAWWTNRSDRYILPFAGTVCLVLGVSLVFGLSAPWSPFAPLMIMVLGLGLVVNAVVGLAAWEASPLAGPGSTRARAAQPAVAGAAPGARGVDRPPSHAPKPAGRSHGRKPAVSSGSPADYHVSPGEFLWASWAPPARRLPVELIGPVPETAHVPRRQGAPSLYEEGEPIVLEPVKSGGQAGGGSSSLLDAGDYPLFPSLTNSVAREPEVYAAVRVETPRGRPAAIPPVSVSGALMERPAKRQGWATPAPSNWTRSEPPIHAVAERPHRGATDPVRCASCRQPLGESKGLRRCLACLRRLCSECAATGHRTRDGVWCRRCSEVEHRDSLSEELARRDRPVAT